MSVEWKGFCIKSKIDGYYYKLLKNSEDEGVCLFGIDGKKYNAEKGAFVKGINGKYLYKILNESKPGGIRILGKDFKRHYVENNPIEIIVLKVGDFPDIDSYSYKPSDPKYNVKSSPIFTHHKEEPNDIVNRNFNNTDRESIQNNMKKNKMLPLSIDKDADIVKRFPQKVRLIVCKYIYKSLYQDQSFLDSTILENIIENLKNRNISKDWVKEILENRLLEISIKLNNINFKSIFTKYFKDLIEIVKIIKKLNDDSLLYHKSVNVREIVNDLRKNNITLFMTQETFEKTFRQIFDFLKENFENFNLDRIKEQRLLNDNEKKVKECGRCHQILSYEAFEKYKTGKRKGFRSICRKCRIELKLISDLNTKQQLLTKYFNRNCFNCNVNLIEILPASLFHHPKDKTYTWSEGREKSQNVGYIATRLKKDGARQFCVNCHRLYTAKIFRKFKDLIILLPNLFELSVNEILNMIEYRIKSLPIEKKSYYRRNIKRFIRKRFIFEQLFNGRCIGCGKVTVNSNLTALEGHHLEKINDKSMWKELADRDCEYILKIFIQEKIIGLCANCHSIIHSVFHKYIENIFGDQLAESMKQIIKKKALENFNRIMNNIKSFQIDVKSINFKSPLKLPLFPLYDAWKLRLLQFFYVTQKLGIDRFRREDFIQFNHINLRNITVWLSKISKLGYINVVQPINSQYLYYSFSELGIKMIKKIEKEYMCESEREKNLIYCYDVKSIVRPLRYQVFMQYYENPNLSFNNFFDQFFKGGNRKRINWYWNEAKKWFSSKNN